LEKLWIDWILFKSFGKALEFLEALDYLENLWSTSRGFRLFGKALERLDTL
jgi:hypothetical protein